jgi:hypothetical protein
MTKRLHWRSESKTSRVMSGITGINPTPNAYHEKHGRALDAPASVLRLDRLPDDVLVPIIKIGYFSSHPKNVDFSIIITHTSTRLRYLALNLPTIWSNFNPLQSCDLVQALLRRSCQASVRITYDEVEEGEEYFANANLWHVVVTEAHRIQHLVSSCSLSAPFLHRLRCLDTGVPDSDADHTVDSSFPFLESLCIRTSFEHRKLPLVIIRILAPRLQLLKLHNSMPEGVYLKAHSLTTLLFEVGRGPGPGVLSGSLFLELLSSLPSLANLDLRIRRVQHFRLTNNRTLGQLILPIKNLRIIILSRSADYIHPLLSDVSLPQLQRLTLHDTGGHMPGLTKVIKPSQCEGLQTLRVYLNSTSSVGHRNRSNAAESSTWGALSNFRQISHLVISNACFTGLSMRLRIKGATVARLRSVALLNCREDSGLLVDFFGELAKTHEVCGIPPLQLTLFKCRLQTHPGSLWRTVGRLTRETSGIVLMDSSMWSHDPRCSWMC